MNEEVDRFSSQGEKIISHELNQIIWCNHMDMLSIVTRENLLEMHRISYKNQKIFQAEESNQITHGAFSPDAKLFVYFLDNGSSKIVKTENGELLFHIKPKSAQSILSSSWINYNQAKSLGKINPFKKYNMLDSLIPQLGPHIYSDKNNLQRLAYFSEMPNDFSLMITNDNQGSVSINLNGIFPLAKFQLSDYFPLEVKADTSEYAILKSYVKSDIETISFLISTKSIANKNKFKVFLLDLEISSFYFMKDALSKVGYLLSFVDEHMQYIKTTFNSILQQLKDIQRAFSSKIFILEDCIKNHSLTTTPIQEFMIYLTTGAYSSALHHYFGKELFDCKILQKMDETIYNTFTNIQEFLLESVLNTLERLTVLLTSIQNSTTYGHHQAFFGIEPEALQRIIHLVSELYVRADKFMKEVTETKIDTRNLVVWMNKCVIKTAGGDTEIENTKSHLNKFSFDIKRLIKIFEDENIFNMKHLFAYFQDLNPGQQKTTSFDQDMKDILTEITNLSIHNQKSDGLQDTLEEYCLSSLEEQFAELKSEVFSNSPSASVELKTPKKLDTGLSNVFRKSEEQSFKFLLQNIEDLWKMIMNRPSESLKKGFRLRGMTHLGEFGNISNLLAMSPQENTEDVLAIAYHMNVGRSECLISLQRSQTNNQCQLSVIQLYNNYDLKEISIWQNNSVLLLLTSNKNMVNDKPHSILGLVDLSSLEGMNFVPQNLITDVFEVLKNNANQITTNPLELRKRIRIDSVNVCKLRASLKGLISVLVDDSKMMFFAD